MASTHLNLEILVSAWWRNTYVGNRCYTVVKAASKYKLPFTKWQFTSSVYMEPFGRLAVLFCSARWQKGLQHTSEHYAKSRVKLSLLLGEHYRQENYHIVLCASWQSSPWGGLARAQDEKSVKEMWRELNFYCSFGWQAAYWYLHPVAGLNMASQTIISHCTWNQACSAWLVPTMVGWHVY